MRRWPIKPLLDTAELTRSRVAEFMGQRNYVATGDLTENSIAAAIPVTFQDRPSRADLIARKDDVLFARMQATNKVIIVTKENENHLWSTGFANLRPKTGTQPRWLAYWLASPVFNARKDALCTGATQKAITNDSIRELEIPLPPFPEQERIVRILDEADRLRRLRAQADDCTSALISSIFHEMFPLAGNAARNYHDAQIEELLNQRAGSIRTGPFGSDLLHSEFITQGIPVLGIDNVVANEFRWTEPRCISESKYQAFKRFRVFPGDVLVTIMGTVGRCAVAPEDLSECISTKHLCVISLDRSRMEPHYLWASILFDESVRHQTRIVGSGAIMEGWNSTIIKKLRIRVPSIERQRVFSAQVAEVRRMKEEQAISRKRLDNLFQSVLCRAFQGDL